MSAETLRAAAALMRERAEAATYVYAPHHPRAGEVVPWFEGGDAYSFDETDGPHIMAWSPAVALAVADWLEESTEHLEIHDDLTNIPDGLRECVCPTALEGPECSVLGQALTVARAYLGEEAS